MNIVSVLLIMLSLTACGDKTAQEKQLVEKSLNDMAYIKGGTYAMGYKNTKPDTTVKSFYISKQNVSWEKYDLFTKINDKKYLLEEDRKLKIFTRSSKYPVYLLTWYQANNYCQFLAKTTDLPYDLPTAAQWEYVGRNGGKLHWDFPTNNGKQELGKNFPSLKQLENQKGNITGEPAPLPVGSIPCTPMGICGLTGEVDQWLKDKNNQNNREVRGEGAGGSQELAHVYGSAFADPHKQWAGFRCVINSDRPINELKATAENKFKNA